MKYFSKEDGVVYDELIGGTYEPIEIGNVSLAGGASVQRGEIICENDGAWSVVGSAADAKKNLAIATADFTADSISAVTPAYFSGVFNREKIICGAESASLDVATFEPELRKQNIRLTSLKNYQKTA